MKITCIACQTEFHHSIDRIDPNGSMVRCRMCNYIFMVFQNADVLESLVTQETNIDQAILNDLLEMRDGSGTLVSANDLSEESCSSMFENIKRPDVLAEENPAEKINEMDYADLPDLSDLEKMIDWDDLDEPGDPPASWCRS